MHAISEAAADRKLSAPEKITAEIIPFPGTFALTGHDASFEVKRGQPPINMEWHPAFPGQAEQLAQRLNGFKNGDWYRCHCPGPAHLNGDQNASLSVRDGKDGLILHCFAGCKRDQILKALAEKGLWEAPPVTKTWVSPVPPDAPLPSTLKPPKTLATATAACSFIFRTAEGAVSFYDCRFDTADGKKEHRPATLWLIGRSLNWKWLAPPKPWTLYHLEQLRERPDASLLICEGCRKTDAAATIFPEYICVAPLNGAKSPSYSDWAPVQGRAVTIWPDHDAPGQAFAYKVADLCQKAGASSVCIVTIPPAFPPKWDLADPLPEGVEPALLHELLAKAEPPSPGGLKAAVAIAVDEHVETRARAEDRPREEWTELGNARRLIRHFGADLRYVQQLKTWFIFDGTHWRRDEGAIILQRAQETIEALFEEAQAIRDEATRTALRKFALSCQNRKHLVNVAGLAQSQSEILLSPDALDADPLLLGVENGTIDLRTGAFRPGRREDYITKRCRVVFDPLARCPNWEAFEEKIAEDDINLVAYKQRVFGLLLTAEVPEILFIAHGEGNNGKTTEMETLQAIYGDYAHASDASLLTTPQKESGSASPEILILKSKRALFINETNAKDWLNEARVKYLTGRDTLYARGLHQDPVNFAPTHKPILRTNHKPKIRGTDIGMWRRIHYIPYTVRGNNRAVPRRTAPT